VNYVHVSACDRKPLQHFLHHKHLQHLASVRFCFCDVQLLTLKWPMFAYVNTQKITPTDSFYIHLGKTYSGNKETYCILQACSIISVLFSTKCCLCHNHPFLFI
jgi:hypothetical protein